MLKTGQDVAQYHTRLLAARAPWESYWQSLADYIQPRKSNLFTATTGSSSSDSPDLSSHQRLFDSTSIDANMVLARGQVAWLTPKESPWFEFAAPGDGYSDETKSWLSRATQRVRILLSQSNLYEEIHELYLDRGGFGTAAMFADYDDRAQRLEFRVPGISSYVAAENGRNQVDTWIRQRRLSHRQARDLFGEDSLPAEVRKASSDPHHWHEEEDYLHAVFPRSDYDPQSPLASQMPIASVWVHKPTGEKVIESGYPESPVYVTRFLRWQGVSDSDSPYGWSPAWAALPDIRQLNYLEKLMDALADRSVNPPILMPDDLDTRADLRPGGQTLFDATKGDLGIPREWMTNGRYDIGAQRANEKRERIRSAFMVDLFEMFAQLDSQRMTATEVNARVQEKIDQFSPTFDLVTSELLSPLLKRVFGICLREGLLGPLNAIPQELIEVDETGSPALTLPRVDFNSRLAMAISSARDQGALRSLELAGQIAQFKPEILDNMDIDKFFRDHYRHSGGDPDHLVDEQQMQAIRLQKAQQMMEMQQQQMEGQ